MHSSDSDTENRLLIPYFFFSPIFVVWMKISQTLWVRIKALFYESVSLTSFNSIRCRINFRDREVVARKIRMPAYPATMYEPMANQTMNIAGME